MYDIRDERGVPISAGVPPLVRIAAGIGVLLIFAVVAMVIAVSGYGHVWPSSDAVKIPLG